MDAMKYGRVQTAGNASVVLVEDDPANRRLMKGILELGGFRVHPMCSGEEGLEWIHANPDGFELLITDVRMPGMNGLELANQVRSVKPGARILFVTGFSDFAPKELVQSGNPGDFILQKPFENSALLRKALAILTMPGLD
jgi:CheY-like chemotaxis protein